MEYIESPIGKIPKLGLGTFSVPKEKLREVIPAAFNLGCCLIDTAYKYQNEECIGEILSASGFDRNSYFIETKAHAELLLGNIRYLRLNRKSPEAVRNSAAKKLRTDYIDIFMLHSPFPGFENTVCKYQNLKKSGKIGLIGICNISLDQLQSLEAKGLLPDIIQVEIHPYHSNKEVIDFAHSRLMIVEARSPFAHGDAMGEWRKEPILKRIAEVHKATIPQVILRWITQQDVIALPRTSSIQHLMENVDSLELSLSEEEMLAIDSLNKGKSYGYISSEL